MKLLINCHTLLGRYLRIDAGIKVSHASKEAPYQICEVKARHYLQQHAMVTMCVVYIFSTNFFLVNITRSSTYGHLMWNDFPYQK